MEQQMHQSQHRFRSEARNCLQVDNLFQERLPNRDIYPDPPADRHVLLYDVSAG